MDSRLIKPKALPKTLLLKDYLLDDFSSCSSNGFKSFPRRQCCTSTVRFLIEMDLKNKQHAKKHLNFNKTTPRLLRNPSKSALAAFQSVIAAVKRLPFGSASSPEKKQLKKSILPRNLSKRILKKSNFWKRKSNQKEIERWKSFDELLKEDSEPLDIPRSSTMTAAAASGNSSSRVNLNSVEARNDAVEALKKGDDVSTESTISSDSSASTNSSTKQKQWSVSDQEKEQFSPVSVLDCPFDDDEEVSSPFQHGLIRMEGTKKKLMDKIERFGCLPQLEPVNLAKRFASTGSLEAPHDSSSSTDTKSISDGEQEQEDDDHENRTAEEKALDLLNRIHTLPSNDLKAIKADKLILDLFTEKMVIQNVHSQRELEEELLEEAENWINGVKPQELYLGWEVPRNRGAYMKDMEKGGEWKSLCQENREVALELEAEVLGSLLNDLLLDISYEAAL